MNRMNEVGMLPSGPGPGAPRGDGLARQSTCLLAGTVPPHPGATGQTPEAPAPGRPPHFCTLGSGRFSRWMTMCAW